jgi:hypothetical protein
MNNIPMNNIPRSPPSFIFQDQGFNPSSFCSGFGASLGNASFQRNAASSTTTSQANLSSEREALDKFLAKSMHALSVEDREKALEEVNGIANTDPEDPFALETCLQELDKYLLSIKQGTVYEMAENMDKDYVTNRAFRLMFLRANAYDSKETRRYDTKRAAQQMKNFFDTKQMLFGNEKLVKDITLDDLDDDDKQGLERGSLQVLPVRDRAGRQIVVNFRGFASFKSMNCELRAKFYLFMSLVESEETQKKGSVVIFYTVGRFKEKNNGNNLAQQGKCILSLPHHWASIQICCDDYRQYTILRALFHVMSAHSAARIRVQYGTHMECLYALRGYGIPEGSIPISPTNSEPLLYNHAVWCKERYMLDLGCARKESNFSVGNDLEKKKDDVISFGLFSVDVESDGFLQDDAFEELGASPAAQSNDTRSNPNVAHAQQASNTVIISPRSKDVLFGQNHKLHPGNVGLHAVISQHADKYEAINGRQTKIEFAGHLVQHIKATGSRFLMFDRTCMRWAEVPDSKARNKVAKTIRNRRRSAGVQ